MDDFNVPGVYEVIKGNTSDSPDDYGHCIVTKGDLYIMQLFVATSGSIYLRRSFQGTWSSSWAKHEKTNVQ